MIAPLKKLIHFHILRDTLLIALLSEDCCFRALIGAHIGFGFMS